MNNTTILILLLVGLVFFAAILIYLTIYLSTLNKIKKLDTENIEIKNKTVHLKTMTTKQKIAQMVVVSTVFFAENQKDYYTRLNVGGIYPTKKKSPEAYKNLIESYQNSSKIKLFVTADLEGAWSPFPEKFGEEYHFLPFSEIKSSEEAYSAGLSHGETLKHLGFNLNFAPVSEFTDKAYGGRAFSGNKSLVKKKLSAYIDGLQKNVMGTCKHYPGRGMIRNTHVRRDHQNITKDDLELFSECFKANVSAVMVGHQSVSGELDSKGKQSSVSSEVIGSIKDFKGIIISDEINMLGLKKSYGKKSNLYKELINAGENVILDFYITPKGLYDLLENLEGMVRSKEISEEKINESVRKILRAKGYRVVG